MRLELVRRAYLREATLGELHVGPTVFATLERPWLGNEHDASCIPCGEYRAMWYDSPSKGRVLQLVNVPGRSMIELHVGNYVKDTEGCILVGSAHTWIAGQYAIGGSAAAVSELREMLDHPDAEPIIVAVSNFQGGQ